MKLSYYYKTSILSIKALNFNDIKLSIASNRRIFLLQFYNQLISPLWLIRQEIIHGALNLQLVEKLVTFLRVYTYPDNTELDLAFTRTFTNFMKESALSNMTALFEFRLSVKMKPWSATIANMANMTYIGSINGMLGLVFLEKGLIRNNLTTFHHLVIGNCTTSYLTVIHIAIS